MYDDRDGLAAGPYEDDARSMRANVPARETPAIPRRLAELEKVLIDLDETVMSFLDMIRPILGPDEETQKDPGMAMASREESDIASNLGGFAAHGRTIKKRLAEAQSRLEL